MTEDAEAVDVDTLFAEFLAGVEAGEEPDLDAICDRHPSAANELRLLHDHWQRLASAIDAGGATDSLVDVYGRGVDPRVSIDGAPAEGRFRVRRVVGRGGMGVVFEVYDPEFRRRLAMKVVRSAPTGIAGQATPRTARAVSRFLQEAQITGQLQHPGILPVHELGADESGQAWFTMPLVEGSTLSAVLDSVAADDGAWSRERALEILARICETMAFAHSRGVIHRDLKPANVMVGAFGEVHVMDWGLARVLGQEDRHDLRLEMLERHAPALEAAGEEAPLLTMDGDVVGTPAYMSPEQARGELDDLGPETDVYAAGALLYHLLTGAPPYSKARGPMEVLANLVSGPPPPIAALAPDAPPALVSIAERAMRREAGDRYPDMGAMSADLRAYLEGHVVVAHESGRWAEARAWVRRNRMLSAALTAAALALVVGGVGMWVVRQVERSLSERFFDLRHVALLDRDAEELWPPVPARVEALEDWLARAEAVLDRREDHARDLERRTRRTAFAADGPQGSEARLETWIVPQLRDLIAELDRMAGPDVAVGASVTNVRRRLEAARALAERSLEHPDWDAALAAIADPDGPYGGLSIEPQLGLVPLGADPRSGLQEFAHLLSGEPPVRDAEGELVLAVESAVVLILLPGGPFVLGGGGDNPELAAPSELARQEIVLDPFFISKFELTRAQWGRWSPPVPATFSTEPSLHPMANLSHDRCREVARRLDLVVPTEAQWEYAARGGTDTDWWWGDSYERFTELEYLGHPRGPEVVGRHAPNGFGLYDVSGNLTEAVRDPLADYATDAPRAPGDGLFIGLGPEETTKTVTRGGFYQLGYRGNPRDHQQMTRIAHRHVRDRDDSRETYGLRPARAVDR